MAWLQSSRSFIHSYFFSLDDTFVKSAFGSLPLAILLHLELSVFIRVPSKRARVCSPLVCKSLDWGGEKGINAVYLLEDLNRPRDSRLTVSENLLFSEMPPRSSVAYGKHRLYGKGERQKYHVIMSFPPFFTFAVCRLPLFSVQHEAA